MENGKNSYDCEVGNKTIVISGMLDFDKLAEFHELEHLPFFLDEEKIGIDSTVRQKPLRTNTVAEVPVHFGFPKK